VDGASVIDVILAGDWDGDGDDTVAVYRPATGRVYVNLENSSGAADYSLYVGNYPIATTRGPDQTVVRVQAPVSSRLGGGVAGPIASQ
jgi:hypothetical protein